jgi:hypothetical protein
MDIFSCIGRLGFCLLSTAQRRRKEKTISGFAGRLWNKIPALGWAGGLFVGFCV